MHPQLTTPACVLALERLRGSPVWHHFIKGSDHLEFPARLCNSYLTSTLCFVALYNLCLTITNNSVREYR